MTSGEFSDPDFTTFDRMVHEPARLVLLAHLAVVEEADFTFLQRATGLTGGNLSSHLKKLAAGGHVTVRKEFVDSKPVTFVQISPAGLTALRQYREEMLRLLELIPD